MSEEQTALEGLQTHPGWHLFLAHVDQEWGDVAVIQKIRSAMTGISRGDEPAEKATTAQILTAQAQVRGLLAWVERRVKVLSEKTATEREEPMISRRGPNL